MIPTQAADLDLRRFIRPGDQVLWSHACGEPLTLVERLIEQRASLGCVGAFAATSFSGILRPEYSDHIRFSSMGAMGALRVLAKAKSLALVPCHFGQIPFLLQTGVLPCDVAFVQVSPEDSQGRHSFGVVNDYMQAMIATARVVIAEINDQVPFTHCDQYLPVDRIDACIATSRPLVEIKPSAISPEESAIARIAAGYIRDGAVLQVGIGGVPDAITQMLGDRRNLGVHSGMIGDGIVDLMRAGVITNATKPFDVGVTVTGSLMGSRRLFDFAHANREILLRASSYTHDDSVLRRIPNMITINSALEVDLTGQVNSEQTGDSYVGGTGGQVDYVRAGSRSPGGHSLIALPSTAGGGKFTRIVARLSGPVSTARSEVDVIITEYGAAELKGLSIGERAKRLVSIAHPDFRAELERDAAILGTRGF